MKLSRVTLLLSFFIIISASFMRQVMEKIVQSTSHSFLNLLIGSMFGITVLAFFIYMIKNHIRAYKIFLISFLVILGLIIAWNINLPQERIHLLEYTILGGLTLKDFRRLSNKKVSLNFFSLIFLFTVSILDEGFQKILPYRVWDVRDIGFNMGGGLIGILLYFIYSMGREKTTKSLNTAKTPNF